MELKDYTTEELRADDLIDNEVAEKLSKEVVSNLIKQITKNERN